MPSNFLVQPSAFIFLFQLSNYYFENSKFHILASLFKTLLVTFLEPAQ